MKCSVIGEVLSSPVMLENIFTGIWWRTAGTCPQNAREVDGKFQKYSALAVYLFSLKPALDVNREFTGAAYDQLSSLSYDFALQQIAAESYLGSSLHPTRARRLRDGNNDRRVILQGQFSAFTRMTPDQADEFMQRYQIIDHHPNDATGFSATLLYDTKENRYTLSFRSSEYRLSQDGGDFDRDVLGADTEINKYGLAFGQLDSMQRYFENLSSGKNWKGVQTEQLAQFKDLIASGGQINVTGTASADISLQYLRKRTSLKYRQLTFSIHRAAVTCREVCRRF